MAAEQRPSYPSEHTAMTAVYGMLGVGSAEHPGRCPPARTRRDATQREGRFDGIRERLHRSGRHRWMLGSLGA